MFKGECCLGGSWGFFLIEVVYELFIVFFYGIRGVRGIWNKKRLKLEDKYLNILWGVVWMGIEGISLIFFFCKVDKRIWLLG